MKSKATLKHISQKLNLSISTVSRALKNHPDISEATKQKVKDLASIIDYEPNTYAINLRTNTSRVLGVIVPAISNLFYDSFISALEEQARENGFSLMILQSGDSPTIEADNLKLCRATRVAGVFISISPGSQPESYKKMEESGIPVIFFDKVPEADSANKVCIADDEVATIAASTIIKYNKKKVLAIFGNPELSITKKREAAFIKVAERDAPKMKLYIEHCPNSVAAEQTVLEYCTAKKVDTVFAMSDEILIGVMKGLYKLDIAIPKEVSVLAISTGFLPQLYKPRITYIETSGYELGKLAMKSMMDYLGGQIFSGSILLPSRLVQGDSL
jgi:DNA-binding LacI/PurR family transcriptional regulator